MGRFHISQDETTYFQLTYEDDVGNLRLMSYQHESPNQLVEDAMEMAKKEEFHDATIVVDPNRHPRAEAPDVDSDEPPAPQRAGK